MVLRLSILIRQTPPRDAKSQCEMSSSFEFNASLRFPACVGKLTAASNPKMDPFFPSRGLQLRKEHGGHIFLQLPRVPLPRDFVTCDRHLSFSRQLQSVQQLVNHNQIVCGVTPDTSAQRTRILYSTVLVIMLTYFSSLQPHHRSPKIANCPACTSMHRRVTGRWERRIGAHEVMPFVWAGAGRGMGRAPLRTGTSGKYFETHIAKCAFVGMMCRVPPEPKCSILLR